MDARMADSFVAFMTFCATFHLVQRPFLLRLSTTLHHYGARLFLATMAGSFRRARDNGCMRPILRTDGADVRGLFACVRRYSQRQSSRNKRRTQDLLIPRKHAAPYGRLTTICNSRYNVC